MATIAKSQVHATDVTERIEISFIRVGRFSLRENCCDVERLALSIRETGLLQPLVVRPVNDSLELVCGHRRLMACRMLRWNSVPCMIREMNDKEAFEVCLSENLQRQTMNPIEEASAFKLYVDQAGWGGVGELAAKIGRSPEYVSHRIALLRLPSQVQQDVREARISPSAAYELLGLGKSLEREAVQIVVDLSSSKLSQRVVRKIVRNVKETEKLDTDEPAFLKRDHEEQLEGDRQSLESAILVYKISLVRLDKIIDSCKKKDIRDILFGHRLQIHSFIDSCIRTKKIDGKLMREGGKSIEEISKEFSH